ncbi:MAG: tryptophan synthase subunit alpha [Treponema sp.]|nr:tryptophan synthase subunit alpha [Treponema sp.]
MTRGTGRIARAFQGGKAFIAFITGGDPSLEKTKEFISEIIRAGADLIEIGVPFSDPIAEGPVIQEANIRALKGGVRMEHLFSLVEDIRRDSSIPRGSDIPLVFLSYYNPVFHYGCDAFFERAARAGLDGIIIPDLPFEEQTPVRQSAQKQGLDLISLIAPTSDQRIKDIAAASTGFIYVVSSMGVTGVRQDITTDLGAMVKSLRSVTPVPAAIGFGIHSPAQASEMAQLADGVIVGSAIVRIIAEHKEKAGPELFNYVKKMKDAIG